MSAGSLCKSLWVIVTWRESQTSPLHGYCSSTVLQGRNEDVFLGWLVFLLIDVRYCVTSWLISAPSHLPLVAIREVYLRAVDWSLSSIPAAFSQITLNLFFLPSLTADPTGGLLTFVSLPEFWFPDLPLCDWLFSVL